MLGGFSEFSKIVFQNKFTEVFLKILPCENSPLYGFVIAFNMYVILYTRGEPGVDWDINNPRQSDITKVFYSVVDPDLADSSNGRFLSRLMIVSHKAKKQQQYVKQKICDQ